MDSEIYESAESTSGAARFLTPFSHETMSPQNRLSSKESKAVDLGVCIMDVVNEVESALDVNSGDPRFAAAMHQWRDILSIMNETAEMILSLTEPVDTSAHGLDVLDVELHRLKTLSNLSRLVALAPDESSPISVGFPNASSTVASEIVDPIEKVSELYLNQSDGINRNVDKLSATLESIVDKALDKFQVDSVASADSDSVEFALMSSPEELESVKQSNTMRWLNDVLKWQAIDMHIQLRRVHKSQTLRGLIDSKKRIIKDVLRTKVDQSGALKKLECSNELLGSTLETIGTRSRQMTQAAAGASSRLN